MLTAWPEVLHPLHSLVADSLHPVSIPGAVRERGSSLSHPEVPSLPRVGAFCRHSFASKSNEDVRSSGRTCGIVPGAAVVLLPPQQTGEHNLTVTFFNPMVCRDNYKIESTDWCLYHRSRIQVPDLSCNAEPFGNMHHRTSLSLSPHSLSARNNTKSLCILLKGFLSKCVAAKIQKLFWV